MIDKLVVDIPDAEKGFRLTFSTQEFPGWDDKLLWRRERGAATGTIRRSARPRAGSAQRC